MFLTLLIIGGIAYLYIAFDIFYVKLNRFRYISKFFILLFLFLFLFSYYLNIMNKAVQLVNEWANFEEQHANASIEDFCRYYLVRKREINNDCILYEGIVPPDLNSSLSKLLNRISLIFSIYARIALKNTELKKIEEFFILSALMLKGEFRKTDLINYNLMELSTGIDILNKLTNDGLIFEKPAPNDKRSKIISLTAKGESVLVNSFKEIKKSSDILFNDMSSQDKNLCMQLLSNVEINHSKLVVENKNKSIDEIYNSSLSK
jgi:DNA-binding MarR family transcriptional regulator